MSDIAEKNVVYYRKNLRKVVAETILSQIGVAFAVPIMTVFYGSIGMNQTDIGFIQMIFTIVLCFLDIPMGFIADRFNRKILNIIGDIGVAFVFLLYASSQNMYMCLASECLLGIFMAMTNGVDASFIKFNCGQIDPSGMYFKRLNIRVQTGRYIALLVVTILGGFVAKYSMRLCIAVSFVPYFISGIIACSIKDDNARIESKHKNVIKDMISAIKGILANKATCAYLYSYVLGNEITHSQIWVFTPLLILCGVPIEIVSLGWVLNYLMQTLGGKLSEKLIKFKTSKQFFIPISIELTWLLVLVFKTNVFTVWLFGLNGFVHGLISANMLTSLQESASDEVQTSVVSIATTMARILYIPIVYVVNYFGNIKLQYALATVVIIFFPLCTLAYYQLKKLEKQN